MTLLKNIKILIKSILIIITVNSFANDNLNIMTEDWPPLNYIKDEKLVGPAVDIVKAIQKEIDNKNNIKVYYWKRAYMYTQNLRNRVLFSMIRSKKRENLFKWVGPIAEKRYSLYSKADFKHKINTLEDAYKFSTGVQAGGFTEEYLKTKGFTKLHKANNATQNARMIMKGRIDLMFDSYSTFLKTLKQYDIKETNFKEVLRVKVKLVYIAFSKDVNDKTILLWQKAYNKLYASGEIEKIFNKHNEKALYWNKLPY